MHSTATTMVQDDSIQSAARAGHPAAAPVAHSVWKTSILYTLVTAVLLGLVYPLVVDGLAHIFFSRQADGSLILRNGQVIGSELLAQSFTSDRYFHPRPSASNYSDSSDFAANSTTPPSGGSNLAQSNKALVTRIQGDIDKLSAANGGKPVPIDMVTQSGSGLDPDITPENAYFQAPRVAKARGLTEDAVRKLIADHTAGRQLGFLGEPRVNVLELNLALDGMGH